MASDSRVAKMAEKMAGKLSLKMLGRSKKDPSSDADLSDSPRPSSDKLQMTGTEPAVILRPRNQTTHAANDGWPQGASSQVRDNYARPDPASWPTKKRSAARRMTVTFAGEVRVIGVGGDDCEIPTIHISSRRARAVSARDDISRSNQIHQELKKLLPIRDDGQIAVEGEFQTLQVYRTRINPEPTPAAGQSVYTGFANSPEGHSRFLSKAAEMRASEGRFLKAQSTDLGSVRQPSPGQTNIKGTSSGLGDSGSERWEEMTTSRDTSRDMPVTAHPVVETSHEIILETFGERTRHWNKLFQLAAEAKKPLTAVPFEEWVRTAAWWFLRGQHTMETLMRAPRYEGLALQQSHADIAKSLWIIDDVLRHHPELEADAIETLSEAHASAIAEGYKATFSQLKAFLVLIQQSGMMPPEAENAPLPQGLDPTIWISYPPFPREIKHLLSKPDPSKLNETASKTSTVEVLPVSDESDVFILYRAFVDVVVRDMDDRKDEIPCPCLLTVQRPKSNRNMSFRILSQNSVIGLNIQNDPACGPTWINVNWLKNGGGLELVLTKRFAVQIHCTAMDCNALHQELAEWSSLQSYMKPSANEQLVFEQQSKVIQVFQTNQSALAFPREPVQDVIVLIFERFDKTHSHIGFRLTMVTNPSFKLTKTFHYDIIPQNPLVYEFLIGDGGSPALLISMASISSSSRFVITCLDMQQRTEILSCLVGATKAKEHVLAAIPISSMSMVAPDASVTTNMLESFRFHQARLVHGRLFVKGKDCSMTDYVRPEPGELRFLFDANPNVAQISIVKAPQIDLKFALMESKFSRHTHNGIAKMLQSIVPRYQTIRSFTFPSLGDLHHFQSVFTGFDVLFDDVVPTVSITRERIVVGVKKHWEAFIPRVQILNRGQETQILIVFAEDFAQGTIMNFAVKAHDVFSSFLRGGRFCIRLVDANFALPKEGERSFCPDIIEYPTERDDIVISFESEIDRSSFAESLPAPVTPEKRSLTSTLRR